MVSAHDGAIKWIAAKVDGQITHRDPQYSIEGFMPDVVSGKSLHEVEMVRLPKEKIASYAQSDECKTLWIAITPNPFSCFQRVILLYEQDNLSFDVVPPDTQEVPRLLAQEELIRKRIQHLEEKWKKESKFYAACKGQKTISVQVSPNVFYRLINEEEPQNLGPFLHKLEENIQSVRRTLQGIPEGEEESE